MPTDFVDDRRDVTCLLGLNINGGQEIKLRLRTADLQGFRKFETIRETLVHELTHNVWAEHDNRFKVEPLLSDALPVGAGLQTSRAAMGPIAEICWRRGRSLLFTKTANVCCS